MRSVFMQVLASNPHNIEYLRVNQNKTLGQICREMGINI